MSATALNITIEQGATFSQVIAVGGTYDGDTARATMRRTFGGEKLADLTCSAISAGNVTISLTAVETAALTVMDGTPTEREIVIGVWDLEAVDGASVVRLRQGKVILSREATT